jgi:excisionase family DNA binding protein
MARRFRDSQVVEVILRSTDQGEDDGMNDERIGSKNRDETIDRWQQRLTSSRLPRAPSSARRPRPSTERPRTVAEAADELGLSVYTIRSWIAGRRLAHIRLGRAIRIPADEIRRVIEAGTVPAERK